MPDAMTPQTRSMPDDTWRQIASWLAATDIEHFEIDEPGLHVRMSRGASGDQWEADPAGNSPASVAPTPFALAATTVVANAPCAGVFLDRHPLRAAPLARPGERVRAGDVIGLLKLGQVLAPVLAPVGGVMVGARCAPGDLVGYGAPLMEISAGEA